MKLVLTELPKIPPLGTAVVRPWLALCASLTLHGAAFAALAGWALFLAKDSGIQVAAPSFVVALAPALQEEVADPEPVEPPPEPPTKPRMLPGRPALDLAAPEAQLGEPIPEIALPETTPVIALPPEPFAASISFEPEPPKPKPPVKPKPAAQKPNTGGSQVKTKPGTVRTVPVRTVPVRTVPVRTVTARASYTPSPVYPSNARNKGWQGTSVFSATISVKGRVTAVQLTSSSGYAELDRSAERALRRWKFKPATRNGVPVISRMRVPIAFRLR